MKQRRDSFVSRKMTSLCSPIPILGWLAVAAFLISLPAGGASAEQVMRVGMTAADIPTTGGIRLSGL
jgi:hypothetical protein